MDGAHRQENEENGCTQGFRDAQTHMGDIIRQQIFRINALHYASPSYNDLSRDSGLTLRSLVLLLIDSGGPQLDAIPTVGFSDPILSYFSALRFLFHGMSMVEYGYRNVRTFVFIIQQISPCRADA